MEYTGNGRVKLHPETTLLATVFPRGWESGWPSFVLLLFAGCEWELALRAALLLCGDVWTRGSILLRYYQFICVIPAAGSGIIIFKWGKKNYLLRENKNRPRVRYVTDDRIHNDRIVLWLEFPVEFSKCREGSCFREGKPVLSSLHAPAELEKWP